MKKILLVEDEPIAAVDEKRTIEKFGYSVVIVHNGLEAVKLAEDHSISLVLMDIDLGEGMDGTQAAQQILAIRHLPLIFLTSHQEEEYVARVKEITRYGYVIKNSGDFVLRSSIEMAYNLFEMYVAKCESEESFRQIYEHIAIAVAKVSLEFRIENANKAYCALLGYCEDEIVGMHLSEITAEEVLEYNLKKQRELAQGKIDHYRLEKKFIHKDGHIVYGILDANAIRDINGNVSYFLGSVIDITERKARETDLKRLNESLAETNEELASTVEEFETTNEELATTNEELFETQKILIEKQRQLDETHRSAHIGIWSWNKATDKVEWSSELFRIAGIPEDRREPSFSEHNILYTAESIERLSRAVDKALKDLEEYNLTLDMVRPDGSIRKIEAHGAPWFNTHNELIGLQGTVMDITESYLAQEQLKNIEWMLHPSDSNGKEALYDAPYDDLTELNSDRTILDSVGYDYLTNIVSDYLSLLGTSSAVYEKNGDYALGIFSSGWCRYLDSVSFENCKTKDRSKALSCGKWHCHESCWNVASKQAIETRKPADIECSGGIRIYAVPICLDEGVIGAINFGYGDPPASESRLKEIADLYGADIYKLYSLSRSYKSRPKFIIDYAKSMLQRSAEKIALIVANERSKKKLEKSEYRYRKLVDEMDLGLALHEIICDENGSPVDYKFLDVNSSFERLTGLKKDSIVGKRVLEVLPKTEKYWIENYGKVALTGEATKFEHYSGELKKYYEVTAFRPQEMQFAVIVNDVTERKNEELRKQQEKQLIERLIDTSPAAIIMLDTEGSFTFANPHAQVLLDISVIDENQRVYNAKHWKIADYEGRILEDHELSFSKVKSTLAPVYNERQTVVSGSGELKYLLINAAPILDPDGNLEGVIAALTDTTEQVVAEREVRRLLSEKELVLKEVHHRIKNNMNSIAALLEMQLYDDKKADAGKIIGEAVNRIKSMGTLYDKLYKSENYITSETVEYFSDLSDEIVASISSGRKIALKKNIADVTVDVRNMFPLGLIINEVMTNAVKYAFPDKNDGEISLSILKEDNYLLLEISDNGVGFTRKKNEGFGFHLIEILVKQLHGHFEIKSDNGTLFTMSIPLD